ncbi:MAG: hypothetical protein AB8H80_05775 [Planctomycetota bacterium]
MNDRQRRQLIEQTTTAWRPRDADGGVRSHPAFHDLDEPAREVAAREAERQRSIEAALDSDGLSSTSRAVLARIRG